MYVTRQRAKSSFTVEIKRANKRSPEVATVEKSAVGREPGDRKSDGSIAARAAKPRWVEQPGTAGVRLPQPSRAEPETRLDQGCPRGQPARRVLPDLLAVDVDPVAQRLREQSEARAARRKALPEAPRRTTKAAPASESRPKVAIAIPPAEPVPPAIAGTPEEPVVSVDRVVAEPGPQRAHDPRKRNAGRPARHVRRGDVAPSLPLGQRWKRRLPQACW
jgi:hypothetical protein